MHRTEWILENNTLFPVATGWQPHLLTRLAGALSVCPFGERIGILSDASAPASAAAQVLTGALSLQGKTVWQFGSGFLPQLYFYSAFCDLQCGLYISGYRNRLRVQLFAAGGVPLGQKQWSLLRRNLSGMSAAGTAPCKNPSALREADMLYARELVLQAGTSLAKQRVRVSCPNERVEMVLEDGLYRAQAKLGDDLLLFLSGDGTRVSACCAGCGQISHARLLAICGSRVLSEGQDLVVDCCAPTALEQIAAEHGQNVHRLSAAAPDAGTVRLAREQLFVRDGLFLSMRLLGLMARSGKTLCQLNRSVPPFYRRQRHIPLTTSVRDVCARLPYTPVSSFGQGVLLKSNRGSVFLTPERAGHRLLVLCEAQSPEIAAELCAEVCESVTKH